MSRCESTELAGDRCELPDDHDGSHRITGMCGSHYTWDEYALALLALRNVGRRR